MRDLNAVFHGYVFDEVSVDSLLDVNSVSEDSVSEDSVDDNER